MLLTFSRLDPWKRETNFVSKIQSGTKIHTFRVGDRWKVGNRIDFWENNPRNVKSLPRPFGIPRDKADVWGRKKLKGNEVMGGGEMIIGEFPLIVAIEKFRLRIEDIKKGDSDWVKGGENQLRVQMSIGGLWIDHVNLWHLVGNQDGFDDYMDFIHWFKHSMRKKKVNELSGQVIYWRRGLCYDSDNAQKL